MAWTTIGMERSCPVLIHGVDRNSLDFNLAWSRVWLRALDRFINNTTLWIGYKLDIGYMDYCMVWSFRVIWSAYRTACIPYGALFRDTENNNTTETSCLSAPQLNNYLLYTSAVSINHIATDDSHNIISRGKLHHRGYVCFVFRPRPVLIARGWVWVRGEWEPESYSC